jgi:hypothetical protein
MPKNNYIVTTSAIKAGFKESTANKQQKKLLHNAMKYEARDLVERIEGQGTNGIVDVKEQKPLMHELLGMTREEVMGALKNIALNSRDFASALKVLAPLSKQIDVVLHDEDQNKTVVPILNVVVKEKQPVHIAQQSHDTTVPTSQQ